MVFSSTTFIFIFLPLTLLGYFILPKVAKNYWLLLISLLFFAWSQPKYLWVILANIVINYLAAMILSRIERCRRVVLTIAVLANLLMLFYFKYFNFTMETIQAITKSEEEITKIILPIGISFFTFQGMSYTIDVFRKDVEVQKNPFKLALYITFFPQLIAGPIVRYQVIAKDIDNRKVRLDDISTGLERFIIGLAKKTIIANNLAFVVDSIWNNSAGNNLWSVAWLASISYTLQIYFDFSGYSDMAIGLGRIFGFKFSENFDLPYVSQSITEFWRRWHISLSSWFKDYVYIPLGGNRKRVYLNLAIVFLLTGIWHGAAWTFILWGVWNGFFILVERVIRKIGGKKENQNIAVTVIKKIYTLLVINLGWVLFRAPSIGDAVQFVRSMFGFGDYSNALYKFGWYAGKWEVFILALGILFSTAIPRFVGKTIQEKCDEKIYVPIKYLLLLALFFFSIVSVVAGTYNPFIYFQF